jgi:hypothetical protein
MTTPPYTETDQDRAWDLLEEFVAREEFRPLRDEASALFSVKRLDDLPAEKAKEYVESGMFRGNLSNFVALEYRGEDGRTFLDRFLAERGDALGAAERRYLEDLRRTRIGFYEVEESVPGTGLRLKDLWSAESHWVPDPGASRALVRWDLLAARLLVRGNREAFFEGEIYPFLPDARGEFMGMVRLARRTFYRFRLRDAPHEFFRGIAAVVHRVWLETTFFRPPIEFRTFEGDEVVAVTSYYEIRDREALVRALDGRPELDRAGEAKWYWKVDPSEGCRCRLGTLTIEADRLVSETHSRERDARLRSLLEEAAGEAIRRGMSRVDGLNVPPVDRCFRDDEVRLWLDHVNPELGRRTPRQAARTRDGRKQLVEILKTFENHEARAALAGREPYDFGWVWKELGLERSQALSRSPV